MPIGNMYAANKLEFTYDKKNRKKENKENVKGLLFDWEVSSREHVMRRTTS